MSDVAMSSEFDFGSVRQRAVSSRTIQVKIPCTNGSKFNPGSAIEVSFPSQVENTYIDMSRTGLLMTIKNTAAAASNANDAVLPGLTGAFGCISRFSSYSGGATIIDDIPSYNHLVSALISSESSKAHTTNVMANLVGAGNGGYHAGKTIAEDGDSITVFLPLTACALANLTPNRLVPCFSSGSLSLRYYLASVVEAFSSAGTPVIEYSDVSLVTSLVEISGPAQNLIDTMISGQYRMLASTFRTSSSSVTGTGSKLTHVSTLGFSMSSVDRVLMIIKPNDAKTQAAQSVDNRAMATLESYSLAVNGKKYPDQDILTGNKGAEALAYLLMSQDSFNDFKHDCQLTTIAGGDQEAGKYIVEHPVGTSEATCGSFIAAIPLSQMPESHSLMAGLNTVGAVTQWSSTFAALTANKTFEIIYYASATVQLSLNNAPGGLRTWQIAV